MQIMSAVDL